MKTKTQHTPGPWEVHRITSAMFNIRSGQDTVANVIAFQGSPTLMDRVGEGEANARIIAASPTMYEYIASRAATGDMEAKKVMESIEGKA